MLHILIDLHMFNQPCIPRNEFHLIIVYDHFNALLNLAC